MNLLYDSRNQSSPGRFSTGWTVVCIGFCVLLTGCPALGEKETTADLLSRAAWEVRVFSFDKGFDLFKKVMAEAPEGSDNWQQAVFGAAVCKQQMVPPNAAKMVEAEELYALLLKKTPKSKYLPRAMMMIGRLKELRDFFDDKTNLEEARSWYQRVVDGWPHRHIAGEATFRIAATYIQTFDMKQVRKGIAILEGWLKKHPEDPMASGMWQYLGDTYFYPLNKYRKSLKCYIRADDIGLLEKGREGPVYWRMAIMADRFLKDRKNAIKYYTKIITITPTSGKAYMSQLALKKLGAPVPKLEMFAKTLGEPQPWDTKKPVVPTAKTPAEVPAGKIKTEKQR